MYYQGWLPKAIRQRYQIPDKNYVAPERPSRLTLESARNFLKNTALFSTTEDEIQIFVLTSKNLLSRKRLFAAKQTDTTEFFSKIG